MMRLFIFSAFFALSACAAMSPESPRAFEAEQAPSGLQFFTEPGLTSAGGLSTLSLRNGAPRPIGYNLCIAALERAAGGLWIPAPSSGASCPQSFQSLAPGKTATGQAVIPAATEPGVYRFVTQLSASSENLPDVQLRSEPFRITD